MTSYPDLVPCTSGTCKAQVHPNDLAAHLAWHANLKASMTAANPLISISLLNGL